jgi:type I site-specific restriction-modification system R (restriction) subunit
VIVVTDRRLLDKQLRDNIKEFSEVKNIVAPAYKSSELKDAMSDVGVYEWHEVEDFAKRYFNNEDA